MKILVIAATEAEIALSIKHIAEVADAIKPNIFGLNGHEIHFATTGVGMVATTYNLTRLLSAGQYDFAIQAGIAGSFDRDIPLGAVLMVRNDRFADLGAEDGDTFTDIFGLGLIGDNETPFTNKILANPLEPADYHIPLHEVDALTLNTVTGRDDTAAKLYALHGCELESMEGAAFHYVCLSENLPFVQIRAVSNYVERRNRDEWKIPEAINNLNEYLVILLNNIP